MLHRFHLVFKDRFLRPTFSYRLTQHSYHPQTRYPSFQLVSHDPAPTPHLVRPYGCRVVWVIGVISGRRLRGPAGQLVLEFAQ